MEAMEDAVEVFKKADRKIRNEPSTADKDAIEGTMDYLKKTQR